MSDMFRWLLSMLLGFRWAVLIDHDRERNIRRICFQGGKPIAWRWWLIGKMVWLLEDGQTEGISYVHGWEPYHPLAPKRWPKHFGGGSA